MAAWWIFLLLAAKGLKEMGFIMAVRGFCFSLDLSSSLYRNKRALVGECCTLLKRCVATGELYSANKCEGSHSSVGVPAFPDVHLWTILSNFCYPRCKIQISHVQHFHLLALFFYIKCSLEINSKKNKCYDISMIVIGGLWERREQAADNENQITKI